MPKKKSSKIEDSSAESESESDAEDASHRGDHSHGRYPVGTPVRKDFGQAAGGWFSGTIDSYDAEEGYYGVLYEDGDREEFSEGEEMDELVRNGERSFAGDAKEADGKSKGNGKASAKEKQRPNAEEGRMVRGGGREEKLVSEAEAADEAESEYETDPEDTARCGDHCTPQAEAAASMASDPRPRSDGNSSPKKNETKPEAKARKGRFRGRRGRNLDECQKSKCVRYFETVTAWPDTDQLRELSSDVGVGVDRLRKWFSLERSKKYKSGEMSKGNPNCVRCREGRSCRQMHLTTCPKSRYFGKSPEQITAMQMKRRRMKERKAWREAMEARFAAVGLAGSFSPEGAKTAGPKRGTTEGRSCSPEGSESEKLRKSEPSASSGEKKRNAGRKRGTVEGRSSPPKGSESEKPRNSGTCASSGERKRSAGLKRGTTGERKRKIEELTDDGSLYGSDSKEEALARKRHCEELSDDGALYGTDSEDEEEARRRKRRDRDSGAKEDSDSELEAFVAARAEKSDSSEEEEEEDEEEDAVGQGGPPAASEPTRSSKKNAEETSDGLTEEEREERILLAAERNIPGAAELADEVKAKRARRKEAAAVVARARLSVWLDEMRRDGSLPEDVVYPPPPAPPSPKRTEDVTCPTPPVRSRAKKKIRRLCSVEGCTVQTRGSKFNWMCNAHYAESVDVPCIAEGCSNMPGRWGMHRGGMCEACFDKKYPKRRYNRREWLAKKEGAAKEAAGGSDDVSHETLCRWVAQQRRLYELRQDREHSSVSDENEEESPAATKEKTCQGNATKKSGKKRRYTKKNRSQFFSQKWDEKFAALVKYKEIHGRTRVTQSVDKKLCAWVYQQRAQYQARQRGGKEVSAELAGRITDERIKKLESIGFEWYCASGHSNKLEYQQKAFDEIFDQRMEALRKYREIHGTTKVKEKIDFSLHIFVQKQVRFYRDRLRGKRTFLTSAKERMRRLEEIGLVQDWGLVTSNAVSEAADSSTESDSEEQLTSGKT